MRAAHTTEIWSQPESPKHPAPDSSTISLHSASYGPYRQQSRPHGQDHLTSIPDASSATCTRSAWHGMPGSWRRIASRQLGLAMRRGGSRLSGLWKRSSCRLRESRWSGLHRSRRVGASWGTWRRRCSLGSGHLTVSHHIGTLRWVVVVMLML